MCPNCNRGLVAGELCKQCAGTGIWNPQSLSVNEVQIMHEDEQATGTAGVEEAPVVETPPTPVGETVTETPEVAPEVVDAPADAGVQAPASEVSPDEVVA